MKVTLKKGLMTSVLLLALAGAAAQEDGNRDANNKIVRGPYETNRFLTTSLSALPAA